MGVAWVQSIGAWSGTSPVTSGAFTPTPGNALLVYGQDGSGNSKTLTFSGSNVFSILTPPGQFNDTHSDTHAIGDSLGIVGGSQTIILSATAGDTIGGNAWEYSSVINVTSVAGVQRSGPGTGNGAITGTAVTVPTGAILLAFCGDVVGTSTLNSPAGTNRGSASSGFCFCATEYAGSGASITPTFTTTVGTDDFVVFQWLLLAGPAINTQPANQSVYVGQTATFTVSATTSGGSLSYQWQQYISGSWTNVGTNSSSYTTGAAGFADNGDKFQVLVTDSNGTTTSATAILTVIGAASIAWLQ